VTTTAVQPDLGSPTPVNPAPLPSSSLWRWSPWPVFAISLGLFVYGTSSIPDVAVTQWGLLGVASPAYGASIVVAAVGFVLAVRHANLPTAFAGVLLTALVLRLPRLISTDVPTYAWTYKHIGVVDYIQHSDKLARGVDLYNGWPGLFSFTAWFSDLTGISTLTLAHWFTPVFHLLLVGLVFCAARAWGLTPMQAVVAAYFVEALNWVEQDYFSPQATALLFVVVIVGLVGLAVRSQNRVLAWPLLIAFAGITITHQLTPVWIMMMVGLLVVTGKIKPWWILIPMTAMLVGIVAANWDIVSHFPLFSGDVTQNVQTNVPTKGVLGQRITGGGMKVLTAAMWLGTMAILLRRYRRKQAYWALGVVALSPLLLFLVQSYGGEVVFRVYLYSLTGCAVVWAPVLHNMMVANLRRFWSAMAVFVVATAAAAQGNLGGWYATIVPKPQLEALQGVLSQAEVPAYLSPAAPVAPGRSSWRYVQSARFNPMFDVPVLSIPNLVGNHFDTPAQYNKLLYPVLRRTDASTYLVFTDQMQIYSWYYGILPWDALPNLKERIKGDPENWSTFYEGNGIAVYVHTVLREAR